METPEASSKKLGRGRPAGSGKKSKAKAPKIPVLINGVKRTRGRPKLSPEEKVPKVPKVSSGLKRGRPAGSKAKKSKEPAAKKAKIENTNGAADQSPDKKRGRKPKPKADECYDYSTSGHHSENKRKAPQAASDGTPKKRGRPSSPDKPPKAAKPASSGEPKKRGRPAKS
eukprot:gnl/Spiro4/16953_TR9142_c0_g1_i1.p1 gnl/Spiro4/16953_TR9142_c0_g1~~gnl/Spiro4/16953_TR9142_c0_g1_i1.p1  ORF type:complete len:183 (+),score=53.29 gnl/Spiro4/16953_TR9142_c0_g1_i1:40-549(+)